MPVPKLWPHRVTVRALPIYTCDNCHAHASGDTVILEILDRPISLEDLPAALAQQPISNTHMPTGWAGYGLERHLCPQCKT